MVDASLSPAPPERVPMQVFFDYTCPFAHKAHHWLEGAGVACDADWRVFSLLEHNYRGDGPPVWELEERQDDISLLIFAGHKLVERERGDLDTYRRIMIETWHETDERLDLEAILCIVDKAGVEATGNAIRDVFPDAMEDHEEARRLGIFGSPTLVFGQDRLAFVKLAEAPTGEAAQSLLDEVEVLADRPEILEIQRPQRPRSAGKVPHDPSEPGVMPRTVAG